MDTTERPKEDQNSWNFILSVFFAVALIGAMWEVWGESGTFPHSVPVFDAILMALAAFRITRLMVYDKITRWFRELFVSKKTIKRGDDEWVELKPFERGLLHTIHELLGCPWCIGFWSALIIVFCYYMFAWAWLLILFLAIAGAGSFIQLLTNAIGWRAENLKIDAHHKEII